MLDHFGLNEKDILHGIDLIYASGLDSGNWTNFLTHLAAMLGGARVALQGHDTITNSNLGAINSGFSPEMVQSFLEYYATINPWLDGIACAKIGVSQFCEETTPRDVLLRSEFYADWLSKQEGIATGAGVVLFRDQSRFLALAANIRLKDEDRLRLPARRALQIFAPHLQRAFAAQRHVAMVSAEGALGAFSATRPDAALMVLGDHGRVLHANPVAEAWMSEGKLHLTRERTLRFADRNANAALRGALSRVGGMSTLAAREIGFFAGRDSVPHVLFLYPLRSPTGPVSDWLSDSGWPRAIAVVRDISGPLTSSGNALARMFGLTGAEQRLAEFLGGGGSLTEFAERHGVSPNTARNQLRAIFQKTGTGGQTDLVLLLHRANIGAHSPFGS